MKTDIVQMLNDGATKETIKAHLMVVDGVAASDATKMLKPYKSESARRNDMEAIVKMIIADNGETKNRQMAQQIEAAGLCKESTAFHYLSLMNFVKEYHKQMSA